MTLKYILTKKYHRKELISCCIKSWEDFQNGLRDTLDIRINGTWIAIKPPVQNYKNYSHGISPMALKRLYPHVYNAIKTQ